MKILSFGEILWDVFTDGAHIGGAPLNFAAHLAKLGNKSYMLSAVGNDDLGEKALKQLNNFGIDCECVAVLDDKETGKCLVTLDENKVPSYNLLNNVAYDFIPVPQNAKNFDILYFGTLALRNAYNRISLENLLKSIALKDVFVDVNIRAPFYSNESVLFAINNATILKISSEELPVISEICGIDSNGEFKDFALLLTQKFKNLRLVIITLGDKGAVCLNAENNGYYSTSCVKVPVVSTVGAGDSFSAAFVHKLLSGEPLQNCLDFAAKVSAFVVSNTAAVPEYDSKIFE